jgi:hypothetical protein
MVVRSAGQIGSTRALRRLATVATIGVVLAGAIGPLTPTAYAAGSSGNAEDVRGIDLETGGPASAIPFVFPDDGGAGSGGVSDPSIALRPAFEPRTRPSEKTALVDEWSRDSRVWANTDGTCFVVAAAITERDTPVLLPREAIVIANESRRAPDRICLPDACDREGLRCFDLTGWFHLEGWAV